MKKALLFFLGFQMATLAMAYGQTMARKDADPSIFTEIPKENLFVHYNSGVLFSGETLYYKVYCLDAKRRTLSTVSKIAYIELVAADRSLVFTHKIKLASGEGQGDFFIPVDVPSGNYKIIGYTRWMKNQDTSSYFQGDLTVINPYGDNRKPSLKTDRDATDKDSVRTPISSSTRRPTDLNSNIQLSMDASSYNQREKVSLNLLSLNGPKSYGSYSLSVHKVNAFDMPLQKTSQNFSRAPEENVNDDFIYLPELRGELISGSAVSKATGLPIPNAPIALSIPGKAFVLDIVETDKNGRFFFNLSRDYSGENAVIQILTGNNDGKIQMESPSNGHYSNLTFPPFRIDSKLKKDIIQRSIHTQIENAYSEIKQDTLHPLETTYPFFYTNSFDTYDLDDYTRFPSIRETFIEVVKYASIRNMNGKPRFSVLPSDPQLNSIFEPLVLMDGIFVQDHTDIIEYVAKNIQTISVFREKYYYGSKGFQGALVFETLDGDYLQKMAKEDTYVTKLFKPEPRKHYFKQEYGTETYKASDYIPDYRYQLLWEPDISLNRPEMTLDFYTSDLTGTFEISLEGFTIEGVPVSIREVIVVE